MPTASHSISQLIQELASKASLNVISAGAGTDFTGSPTAKLQLKSPNGTTYTIETSEGLSAQIHKRPAPGEQLKTYLQTLAKRMQTARPDVFLTLHGSQLSLQ